MASGVFVDYKAVKAAVSIEQVLSRYGLLERCTRKGDRLAGPCPVHKGSNTKAFSADVRKGAWKCFSGKCTDAGKKGGNVIDLVAAIEGVEFREAAAKLQEWFSVTPSVQPASKLKAPEKALAAEASAREAKPKPPAPQAAAAADVPVEAQALADLPAEAVAKVGNKPLTFRLKLDPAHPYLTERGLTAATVEYFGLGVAGKGSMAGRLAIPIHNEAGELVAYAGRWVGKDEDLPEGEGKYKLPAGFHKGLVVFNAHRVPEGTKRVIIVEGFWSVFWLHQNGFPNVVSVMGSSISPEQVKLLAECVKGVQIFFDGDPAGRDGASKVAGELVRRVWVKIVDCPDGLQPDKLPAHELKRLLA